ncbi:hypothetical protein [Sodalis sp. RH20]|uniref:hypothetical protein n=1 Tax=unclassified Sodalis (in: enterobacteria) TaxID=2636512 RepID=UPI0039B4DCBE
MVSQHSFEEIKNAIFSISGHMGIDQTELLNARDDQHADEIFNERLTRLLASYADARLAARRNDRAMLKTSLLQAKLRTMSLTTFFTALEDDCIALLSLCDAAAIPAGQDADAV